MEEIKDILKGLLQSKGINQKALAESINIGRSTVSEWLSGKKQPTAYNLKVLSVFFDVSVDYLLGLENEQGEKLRNNEK